MSCIVVCFCLTSACSRKNNGDVSDDKQNNSDNGNNGDINNENTDNPENSINPDAQEGNGENQPQGQTGSDVIPGNNLENTPKIDEVFNAVSTAYGEDFVATHKNDEVFMTEKLGIDMEKVDSFFCNTAEDTSSPDIFVGVKAKNSEDADIIETSLKQYRDKIINNAKSDNSAIINKINNSEVVRHGDYVFLMTLGHTDNNGTDGADSATFAKDQVKIAIDKIAEFFE